MIYLGTKLAHTLNNIFLYFLSRNSFMKDNCFPLLLYNFFYAFSWLRHLVQTYH